MKIGYSFWGFLGAGILDTPDGGRFHRRWLVEALCNKGHEMICLQQNRDEREAGLKFRLDGVSWAEQEFPELDCLLLEWRWPIVGRSVDISREHPNYTPDWDRQQDIVEHYVRRERRSTLIWDKDIRMDMAEPLRALSHVCVLEAALRPRPGARTLLFPVDDAALCEALLRAPGFAAAFTSRPIDLLYVGNQYDRDDAFDEFFVPMARNLRSRVYGKWVNCNAWPDVAFEGRLAYEQTESVYETAKFTMLLLPARYRAIGQMTTRLPEAIMRGCVPFQCGAFSDPSLVVPPLLQVKNAQEASIVATHLVRADADERLAVIRDVFACLRRYRLSVQMRNLQRAGDTIGVGI